VILIAGKSIQDNRYKHVYFTPPYHLAKLGHLRAFVELRTRVHFLEDTHDLVSMPLAPFGAPL
jgi:hypothetical protein